MIDAIRQECLVSYYTYSFIIDVIIDVLLPLFKCLEIDFPMQGNCLTSKYANVHIEELNEVFWIHWIDIWVCLSWSWLWPNVRLSYKLSLSITTDNSMSGCICHFCGVLKNKLIRLLLLCEKWTYCTLLCFNQYLRTLYLTSEFERKYSSFYISPSSASSQLPSTNSNCQPSILKLRRNIVFPSYGTLVDLWHHYFMFYFGIAWFHSVWYNYGIFSMWYR